MDNYIFISNEGHTFQPNSNSIEPDCENEQVLGYASGNTEEEAFKNLLINYDYLFIMLILFLCLDSKP